MAILQRRKSAKGLVAFTVRIRPELKERLEERGRRELKTMSHIVDEILSKELGDV